MPYIHPSLSPRWSARQVKALAAAIRNQGEQCCERGQSHYAAGRLDAAGSWSMRGLGLLDAAACIEAEWQATVDTYSSIQVSLAECLAAEHALEA